MKLLRRIFIILGRNGYLKWMPDKLYLKIRWRLLFNSKLDFKNPKSFNAKLQWQKIYDRNDIYTTMVDKASAKDYVSNIIGKQYIIPTLFLYNSVDEIDFSKLPKRFVIKCTHGSHCNIIVKDKNTADINKIKNQLKKWLKKNWYWFGREWPYKNIKPRILIEEYKEDCEGELKDYKVYAFNGKCDYVMVCFNRGQNEPKFIYYDRNWNMKPDFSNDGIKYGKEINIPKPKNLDKMFLFASKLSQGFSFIRVDFYEANDKLFFGELTFFPSSGFDNTRTKECQKYLDESFVLLKKK